MDYDENMELIQRAKNGDNDAKNKLIENNSPLVKSIVRRYKNKGVEYDDLFQLGCVGMTKAINNFDTKYNVKFSTYAVPMIAGEIKRFLRDDGSVKVSRSIKGQCYKISRYISDIQSKENRTPQVKEIAEKFCIDENELMFIMESNKMPLSIYERLDKNESAGMLIMDRIASLDNQEALIDKMTLKDVIMGLDVSDRKLIMLRFFRDKTQSEVAKMMNVSQVQVSRIENRLLKKLRSKLER